MTEIEILRLQIAALKELIEIKDQTIAAINYRTQVQSVQYQTFIQQGSLYPQPYQLFIQQGSLYPQPYQPFIQQTPFSPQPYQPTIICETPFIGTGSCGSGGTISGTVSTVAQGCAGSLVMDSQAIKLATNNLRNIG